MRKRTRAPRTSLQCLYHWIVRQKLAEATHELFSPSETKDADVQRFGPVNFVAARGSTEEGHRPLRQKAAKKLGMLNSNGGRSIVTSSAWQYRNANARRDPFQGVITKRIELGKRDQTAASRSFINAFRDRAKRDRASRAPALRQTGGEGSLSMNMRSTAGGRKRCA